MKRIGLMVVVLICLLLMVSYIYVKPTDEIDTQATVSAVYTPTPTEETPEATPTETPEPTVVPTPTTEPTPEPTVAPRYGFTDDEVYLLAQLLCGSADKDGDGEYDFVWATKYEEETNYAEISKVLCVVMNRARSDEFPDTVTDVVMQKGQFAVMPQNASKVPDQIAIDVVQEWCDAYDAYNTGVQSIPETHLYFTGNGVTNTTR